MRLPVDLHPVNQKDTSHTLVIPTSQKYQLHARAYVLVTQEPVASGWSQTTVTISLIIKPLL